MPVVLVFIVSIILGSFSNNLISYYIADSNFDILRSKCQCNLRTLSPVELIPVFSFCFWKGKCKKCKDKISGRYPLVEIAFGLIGIITYLKYNLTLRTFFDLISFFSLITIAVVDFKVYRIPNTIIAVLLLVSITQSFALHITLFLNIIIAAIICLTFIIINFLAERLKKQQPIGYGDIKLFFVLLLIGTIPAVLFSLWFASFIALVSHSFSRLLINFKDKQKPKHTEEIEPLGIKRVPFGFYLCLSFILVSLNWGFALSFVEKTYLNKIIS
jgi:prepilin signal peptidase PulO-like enzyme (type II secretory pathway)